MKGILTHGGKSEVLAVAKAKNIIFGLQRVTLTITMSCENNQEFLIKSPEGLGENTWIGPDRCRMKL